MKEQFISVSGCISFVDGVVWIFIILIFGGKYFTCDILISHSFILRIVRLSILHFCSCTCTVILSSCSVKYSTRQQTSLISSKCVCSYFYYLFCFWFQDVTLELTLTVFIRSNMKRFLIMMYLYVHGTVNGQECLSREISSYYRYETICQLNISYITFTFRSDHYI